MTRRRVALPLLLLLAVAALAIACGGDDEPASSETEHVEMILDWFPNADHASIYTAQEAGHFSDAGLDVKLTVPSDPAAALKQVGTGNAEFAISYEPEVLLARSEGVPVVAVGALVTHPLNSVIVRSDRGISRPRDLEGKTVGATGLPSDKSLLQTVVRADGGDPSKVTIANVGFTLGPAIASGKVDALIGAYWNIEVPEIEDKGVALDVFRLEQNGVPDYDELVVVTSDAVIEKNPRAVRRVLAALREGALTARDDQALAASAVLAANEDLNAELVAAQVEDTVPLLAPEDEPILNVEPTAWVGYAEWMRAEGLLKKPVDARDAVTAEFLPEP
ncbi:MAG: ABC transporter substrate-binding protein [Thermoleophilia bacterium]|nr:ABC transporter substrate-binding protein [Thermoleophilia bacterium]MDH3724610.1 ABC transporter substrate-binding protein [Thermoleophilia bacterium]